MLEKLRRKRRDELERYDLGGVYDDIAQELRDVVDMERDGLDEIAAARPASRGDQRRQEITEQVAAERRMQLDMLPPDLAGQVQGAAELRVHLDARPASSSRSCSTSSASSSCRATSTRWPGR